MTNYKAVTAFLVSDKTRIYYHGEGILKKVSESESRDLWYFRVKGMKAPYEVNVDPDLANNDTMTIFINYKVFGYDGSYLGATGVGLTVRAVKDLIERYQEKYGQSIYFLDRTGKVALYGSKYRGPASIAVRGELSDHVAAILSGTNRITEFEDESGVVLMSSRFIPELNWILVVEQPADALLRDFRSTLKLSLAVCAFVTLIVFYLNRRTVNYFNAKLADLALLDDLTGLPNRRAFTMGMNQIATQAKRAPEDLTLLMADIDHFKKVNDEHGHLAGDEVLKKVATMVKSRIRGWDLLCRWGGEEFLVLLKGASPEDGVRISEEIRASVENEEFIVPGASLRLTVSLGVTVFNPHESEPEALARVDRALYAAKESGRNKVTYLAR